ncbi:hypothetical protein R1flu_012220 [Riccia fluitans]|uniref:Uncharacterized protein n=1 Tax=Riccia fluitans TaxID=41844 RepID=A0ABD1ZA86_9MARC
MRNEKIRSRLGFGHAFEENARSWETERRTEVREVKDGAVERAAYLSVDMDGWLAGRCSCCIHYFSAYYYCCSSYLAENCHRSRQTKNRGQSRERKLRAT